MRCRWLVLRARVNSLYPAIDFQKQHVCLDISFGRRTVLADRHHPPPVKHQAPALKLQTKKIKNSLNSIITPVSRHDQEEQGGALTFVFLVLFVSSTCLEMLSKGGVSTTRRGTKEAKAPCSINQDVSSLKRNLVSVTIRQSACFMRKPV